MTNKNELELSDGALRQRRNLFVVTLFLMAIELGNISIASDIKILGTTAKVGNPELFIPALFAAQIYFLWRFVQYVWSDDAYGHLMNQRNTYINEMQRKWLDQQIFIQLPQGINTRTCTPDYNDLIRENSKCLEFEIEYTKDEKKTKQPMSIPVKSFVLEKAVIWAKHIYRGKVISDYYLPIFLVVVNAFIWFY